MHLALNSRSHLPAVHMIHKWCLPECNVLSLQSALWAHAGARPGRHAAPPPSWLLVAVPITSLQGLASSLGGCLSEASHLVAVGLEASNSQSLSPPHRNKYTGP